MNKLFISLLVIGAVSFSFSQEQVNPQKQNSTEINGRLTESERQELKAKKDLLTSLDKKEQWIRSNPDELKIAQENGWFKKAEQTRAEVRKRIKELENK